jgi:type IV secretion system protein VirB9
MKGRAGIAALLAAACSLFTNAGFAQPAAAAHRGPDPRLQTVFFAPDRVLDVPVGRGQITQIVLGDDEQIVGVPLSGKGANCADETHTWCIARQGQDLFIKPKTGATSTNLLVVTDRRRHAFVLHPVDGRGMTLMRLTVVAPGSVPSLPPSLSPSPRLALISSAMPLLLTPPAAPAPAPAPAPITAQELVDERWRVKPAVRNTAYSVATGKDSDDIVPVMVFDDGTQTYFSFPNNRPLPAVFEVAADGSEEMVNTRMDADDQLVADRVGRRFILRLGQSVAAIINEAFDLDGVAPKDGTTVAGVARVLKTPGSTTRPSSARPKAATPTPTHTPAQPQAINREAP